MAAIVTFFGVDSASLILSAKPGRHGRAVGAGDPNAPGEDSEVAKGFPRRGDVHAAIRQRVEHAEDRVDVGFHDFTDMSVD